VRKVSAVIMAVLLISSIVAQGNYAFAEPKTPDKYVPDRLVIKFKKGLAVSIAASILNENDVAIASEISQINVKILKVPAHALEEIQAKLANQPGVAYVEKDYLYEPAIIPNEVLGISLKEVP